MDIVVLRNPEQYHFISCKSLGVKLAPAVATNLNLPKRQQGQQQEKGGDKMSTAHINTNHGKWMLL